MRRRQFLKNSLLASTFVGLSCAATKPSAGSASNRQQEFYELRVYRLKTGGDKSLLDTYLENAAIPGLNRLGIKPIGVFVEKEPKDAPVVLVLIPYANLDIYATSVSRLNADQQYLSAGAAYLQTSKDKPAYDRIDSWLMRAFAGIPTLELPPYSREKRSRMFEIRTYESHSESKALKKIDMFNNGEIQLMRDAGLGPIFFGQALVGKNLPHLTYMLSAENEAAHKEHWGAFGKHPTWAALQKDPQYADTVSKITNWFVVPTAYSQI